MRFYHLGAHELWYDEIFTVSYARFPWGNWNAPLYGIFLHYWTQLWGFSEVSLRFPSLLFSFFSVVLVYLLGKEIFDQKTAVIGAFLMGLSPFHLWYAQEARDYSMVLFIGLLSSFCFSRALKEKKTKIWISFVLISLTGFYTNYFYIFLFIAQTLYFLFIKRRKLSLKEAIYFLMPALGFVLYLPRFLHKFLTVKKGFWVPVPMGQSLRVTLENFVLGYHGSALLYLIADMAVLLLFVCAGAAVYRKKEQRAGLFFCLFLFLLPLLAVFAFSKLFFSVYLDRGLIIFSPYFYLILSWGVTALRGVKRTGALFGLIGILLISNFRYSQDLMYPPEIHHRGTYTKKPVKPAAGFIENHIEPGDIIAFTNESILSPFEYYSGMFPCYYFFDPGIPDTSWQRPVDEDAHTIPLAKIPGLKFKKLWVLASDWGRTGKLCGNSQSVLKWCAENLKLELSCEVDGLWMGRYARNE
ncbi:MAG: glycosyltransferase family 39 protein [Candidatus Omnitrophota bacterium]